ncbi:MAG: hypothetical protein AAF513_12450 [Pseudomonadota bacterium]
MRWTGNSTSRFCHALGAGNHGVIPNLAWASAETHAALDMIVLGGARTDKGMVSFAAMLNQQEVGAIQAWIVHRAHIASSRRGEFLANQARRQALARQTRGPE